jgi:hypothetical protein
MYHDTHTHMYIFTKISVKTMEQIYKLVSGSEAKESTVLRSLATGKSLN